MQLIDYIPSIRSVGLLAAGRLSRGHAVVFDGGSKGVLLSSLVIGGGVMWMGLILIVIGAIYTGRKSLNPERPERRSMGA